MHTCHCGLVFGSKFKIHIHMEHCDAWRMDGIPDPSGTQTCKSCLIRKELNLFNKHPNRKNGYDATCKSCTKRRSKNHRIMNAEAIKISSKKAYEENREIILENKNEHYYENRDVILERKKIYTKNHVEDRKEYIKTYRIEHKNELHAKSFLIRTSITNAILNILGAVCEDCGITEREFLTIDHINNDGKSERHLGSVGWKRNIIKGKSDITKYRVLCHSCNLSRYHMNPVHHLLGKELTGVMKKCPTCCLYLDRACFHHQKKKRIPNGIYYECKYCKAFRRAVIRVKALESLGGKCECCGERNYSKLSFDHINTDGSRRRKFDKPGEIINRKILKGLVSGIRILCFNCNFSASRGNGICIHKRENKNHAEKYVTEKIAFSEKTEISHTSINKFIRHDVKDISLEDFELSDVLIHECMNDEAKLFFDKYSNVEFEYNSHSVYGASINDSLIAVAKFASVARPESIINTGCKITDLLELDQFCIHPMRYKKDFIQYFILQIMNLLKMKNPHLCGIVSLVDSRLEYVGRMHKESNWKLIGMTHPNYFYTDLIGNEIHKKIISNAARSQGLTENIYAEMMNLRKNLTPPKIRFFYQL
jgi:hypothetical protein